MKLKGESEGEHYGYNDGEMEDVRRAEAIREDR